MAILMAGYYRSFNMGHALQIVARKPQHPWGYIRSAVTIGTAAKRGGTDENAEQRGCRHPPVFVEQRPSHPPHPTLLITANPYLIDAQVRKASYHPMTSFESTCFL
jgi:hypothetical protein